MTWRNHRPHHYFLQKGLNNQAPLYSSTNPTGIWDIIQHFVTFPGHVILGSTTIRRPSAWPLPGGAADEEHEGIPEAVEVDLARLEPVEWGSSGVEQWRP